MGTGAMRRFAGVGGVIHPALTFGNQYLFQKTKGCYLRSRRRMQCRGLFNAGCAWKWTELDALK